MATVNKSLDDLEDDIKSRKIPAGDMKELREEQQKHKVNQSEYSTRKPVAGKRH